MGNGKILLTAFRNSSAEKLVEGIGTFDILLLPNDKVRDSEMLTAAISAGDYSYVFSVGQRPNIKNKVHIETTARAGDISVVTNYDCAGLAKAFQRNGIGAKLSNHAGTSYCNQLYLNGLRFLAHEQMNVKMVFIHIPYLRNIADLEVFRSKFLSAIQEGAQS